MGQGSESVAGKEVMSVASVNVWSGRARIRTLWSVDRIAPCCLETAVDIATFIISWIGPTTKG